MLQSHKAKEYRPPLATIIIPIFNHAKYAVQTVRSAVEQTYNNIEIIVVDDGSTDDGTKLIKQAFSSDVRVIEQSNRGPSAAVNTALREAEGEYIVLLGGDDICSSDRVDHQITLLSATKIDGVFSRPELIDSDSNALDDREAPFFRSDVQSDISLNDLFFKDNFLCASGATLRADLFERLGLMHEGLIQLQDYDLWLRACAQGMRLKLYERPVIKYRRHQNNLSAQSRTAAALVELPVTLVRSLRAGKPDTLRKSFQNLLPLSENNALPLDDFEVALILLAHPRSEARARGMQIVIDLLNNPQFMSSEWVNKVNMFRFAYNSGA